MAEFRWQQMKADPPGGRAARELGLLLRLSESLERSVDLQGLLSPVLAALASELGLHHGTLTLLNRQTGNISIEVAHELSETMKRRGRYAMGEGVTGTVVATGEPLTVARVSESPLFLDRTRRQAKAVVKAAKKARARQSPPFDSNNRTQPGGGEVAFLCVPVRAAGETYGALSATRAFVEEGELLRDMRLLRIVAAMIAQAVKRRRVAREGRDRLAAENAFLKAQLKDRFRPSNIVGDSHEMQEVYDQIAVVSSSNTSVLIVGETGTGKELVAQAIHYNSDRSSGPFVKVHCAALPESLIESELFGHVKGAFTGAIADRKGRFELAHGGTLLLDEVGDIPPTIQIKLLRVLQEREFERVGGTRTIKIDVRVIAATNKDLAAEAAQRSFREDLYYRLNVFPIHVPALRKRKGDVVLLADFFIERYATLNRRKVRRLSSAVIDMLMSYHWPGNVRELESCIERAVLVAEDDVIHPYHLPPTLQTAEDAESACALDSLKYRVESYERDLIRDVLKSCRGNVSSAASMLQSTPRIIGYKIKKFGIDPKSYSR